MLSETQRRPGAAADPERRQAWGRSRLLFALCALAFVLYYVHVGPMIMGDGREYLLTVQAFSDHASPDLRLSDVQRAESGVLLQNHQHLPNMYGGFYPAHNGSLYCWHFWMYPLVCVPAFLLSPVLHRNPLNAFQITNAVIFALALYVVLFHSPRPPVQRWLLAGLAAIGPAFWYVPWTSPEVYSWALVLVSLTLLDARHYGWSALAAAFAAMQNPPVLFLAACTVLLSLRARRRSATLWSIAGTLPALLPSVFWLVLFGHPSLIAAHGEADSHLISVSRLGSMLFDLNQGMLPSVPILLLLAFAATVRAVTRREVAALSVAVTLIVMMLACESTTNWNSGNSGIQRYSVWLMPVLAWLVVEALPPTRLVLAAAALAVVVQGAVVRDQWRQQAGGRTNYLWQSALADFVLSHAPALYQPEPAIFFERQVHRDGYCYPGNIPALLPVAYARPDGVVTQILLDRRSLDLVPGRYQVSPEYWQGVRARFGGRDGLFYLDPPDGTVRLRPGG